MANQCFGVLVSLEQREKFVPPLYNLKFRGIILEQAPEPPERPYGLLLQLAGSVTLQICMKSDVIRNCGAVSAQAACPLKLRS